MTLDRRSFLKTTAAGFAAIPAVGTAAARKTRASADDDPLGVRGDFPVTRTHVYLNNAAVGPLTKAARDAAIDFVDEKMLRPWPGTRSKITEAAREKFASMFGAKNEEIALLYSTSDGENIVARGLGLERGDNVVLDDLHFSTSFILYREIEKELGIELRIVDNEKGATSPEAFDAAIDDRTRLVSVAWVSNRNGYRHDLKALADLAHARGAYLFTDAIQAMGMFPTDLHDEGVDFLASGSYKWLFANFGVAPMYVREELLERIPPDRYGHSQAATELPDHRYELQQTAKKYEYGALAYTAMAQLDASLGYLDEVGLDKIEKHSVGLAQELRDGIAALGYEPFTPPGTKSAIVSFPHGQDPEALSKRLLEEDIVVTFRENGELIRLGVGMFNNQADIQHFLAVLKTVA